MLLSTYQNVKTSKCQYVKKTKSEYLHDTPCILSVFCCKKRNLHSLFTPVLITNIALPVTPRRLSAKQERATHRPVTRRRTVTCVAVHTVPYRLRARCGRRITRYSFLVSYLGAISRARYANISSVEATVPPSSSSKATSPCTTGTIPAFRAACVHRAP